MIRTLFALVGFFLTSHLLQPTGTSYKIGDDWTTVKRGTRASPIEFSDQGAILFREGECRLEVSKEDATTTEIEFSPLSPDAEYRIVIGDVYDREPAYLLDMKKCGLMHLSVPRYFLPWVSWSPDGKHALFYSDYEASPQLWIFNVETGQLFEVHRSKVASKAATCCGLNEWAPKSGVGYLVPESVHWNDALNFMFKLEISCNPYADESGWPCESNDNGSARATYDVSVSLESLKVGSGPRILLPVRQGSKKN